MEREVTNVTVDQLDHDRVHLTLTFKVTKYEIFCNLEFFKNFGDSWTCYSRHVKLYNTEAKKQKILLIENNNRKLC